MTTAVSSLLHALRQFRVLDAKQLEEAQGLPLADPKALARELLQREWLTPYQANLLLQDRGHELLLGSYVLLERLGAGGMGQVFKARNWKLGKVVAVKLIHKERVANPHAVKRFEREVRAAAHLNHPNIVLAYDADEVSGTHLLVMEYVAGMDLHRLVKEQGPLPAEQACDCIWQAALGLQHAQEQGLVHRDIKPHNLLLTRNHIVKILDLGLARLDHPTADGEQNSTMTREGVFMGTADYIAPEQAVESHSVDIRADLYSLGCTFYFLLTGGVPFPGGSLIQKVNKQQFDEPQPVEQVRPDVPAPVALIVRKLMAKKPDDRYQTPGELVAALAQLEGSGEARGSSSGERTIPIESQTERATSLGSLLERLTTGDTAEAIDSPYRLRREAAHRRWLLLNLAGGLMFLGAIGLFVALLFRQSSVPQEARTSEAAPPRPARSAEEQLTAVVKKLRDLNPSFDGTLLQPPNIEKGVVTRLHLNGDQLTDLSPVQELTGLRELYCRGLSGNARLKDLSPLQRLRLTGLDCQGTQVADLSPLKGMPLTWLNCDSTRVADLSPLKGMPLTWLHCGHTQVTDLTPLQDLKLTDLDCHSTPVASLAGLKDMKLSILNCQGTLVTDLSPLTGMLLLQLSCNDTRVADLSPLRRMPLTTLGCGATQVSDLSPLKDAPLTSLQCNLTLVSDLSPLKGMELTSLMCWATSVSDLSPLKEMPLTLLWCQRTKVTDLTPLQGMSLDNLLFTPQQITRGMEVVRQMKSLKTIGVHCQDAYRFAPAEFWKKNDAGEFR